MLTRDEVEEMLHDVMCKVYCKTKTFNRALEVSTKEKISLEEAARRVIVEQILEAMRMGVLQHPPQKLQEFAELFLKPGRVWTKFVTKFRVDSGLKPKHYDREATGRAQIHSEFSTEVYSYLAMRAARVHQSISEFTRNLLIDWVNNQIKEEISHEG